jgi:hypothetical protein
MVRSREKKKVKRAVQATDIYNLALICKVLGVLLILFSLCFALLSIKVGFVLVSLFGIIGVVVGVLFFILGVGLNRYRMWAWYLGVAVLVPLNIIGGVLGLIFLGFGIISVVTISMVLSAFYVSWVLLSKGGRSRYKKMGENSRYAEENPDSRAAQILARRKRK